jgi:divalent metal cation (Fe/Co/Zn/Cd) transporter
LTDTAPGGVDDLARAALRDMPDIARIERVRSGPRGSVMAVDVEIAVGRTLPLETVSEIRQEAIRRIHAKLPGAEIVVQTRPLALDDETILDRVLVIAAAQRVPVHHVTVQHADDQFSVSFDLEVDGSQTIEAAHKTASALERAIRRELGDEIEVESHIEPLQIDAVTAGSLPWPDYRQIRDTIESLAEAAPVLLDAHDIRVRQTAHGLYISFHCHVPRDETVETVHSAASTLENQIREQIPGTRRIIVHTEPPAMVA